MPSEFIPWVVLSMALIIILGILFIGITRGISGSIAGIMAMTRAETTMVAVLHTSGDEYYVEVVWTWAPKPIKPLPSPMAKPYHHQTPTNAGLAMYQHPIGTVSILSTRQARQLVY
ncbi:hypothetical protein [Vulcanisaeta sp. JCM 16159]|uniref:hypothetical protein n=1 Tax=Vulcanisaeta sp. JCM 16159 TaxID=1295371 RepID=UPI0006D09B6F|nr:hypothetical protein [Vulcanisaeta sp. JCM 16159]